MMLSILTGPLRLLVNYFLWMSVYTLTSGGIIAGRTFEEMMVYIFIANLLFYTIWDNAGHDLAHYIQHGELFRFLLEPLSFWRISLAGKVGHRFLAFFLEQIPVFFIFLLIVDVNPFVYAHNFPLLVISIGMAFFISFFYNVLIGCIAFWTEKGENLVRLSNALGFFFLGMIFPLDLYPVFIQKILFFLPFQFLVYVPTQVYLGEYTFGGISLSLGGILLYQFIYMIVLLFVMRFVWKLALKRFGAVGG
jgi:ABC-2 type transport system permease protein